MFMRGPDVHDPAKEIPFRWSSWVKQVALTGKWTAICIVTVLVLATVVIRYFSDPDSVTYRLQLGLTRKEVVAIAGRPITTQVSRDGEEIWTYWRSKCGMLAPLVPLCVQFDNEGKIIRTWI